MKKKIIFMLLPVLLLTGCQQQTKQNTANKNIKSSLTNRRQTVKEKLAEQKEKYINHGTLSQKDKDQLAQIPISAFGDSIMEGCRADYQKLFPKIQIDAGVSRQVGSVIGELQSKSLANTVLIGLGTNGPFSQSQFDQIMHIIGSKREVYFINTNVDQDWQEEVNDVLAAGSKRYGNVHVIDWNNYSAGHEDWFWDGIHPNIQGRQIMVDYVGRNILANKKY